MTTWADDLRAFWFDELEPKQWFERSDAVDGAIRSRFGAAYAQVAPAFALEVALASPALALAHALLLDQLPRNMFRGSPRAFESDSKALALAKEVADRGLDLALEPRRRLFVYLPFEHSEQLADQERSIGLFTALGDPSLLKYAVAHHEIIARFGRFPHRNAALGRASTPEEAAFLQTPGSGF